MADCFVPWEIRYKIAESAFPARGNINQKSAPIALIRFYPRSGLVYPLHPQDRDLGGVVEGRRVNGCLGHMLARRALGVVVDPYSAGVDIKAKGRVTFQEAVEQAEGGAVLVVQKFLAGGECQAKQVGQRRVHELGTSWAENLIVPFEELVK
jgi:hypothetical protein